MFAQNPLAGRPRGLGSKTHFSFLPLSAGTRPIRGQLKCRRCAILIGTPLPLSLSVVTRSFFIYIVGFVVLKTRLAEDNLICIGVPVMITGRNRLLPHDINSV